MQPTLSDSTPFSPRADHTPATLPFLASPTADENTQYIRLGRQHTKRLVQPCRVRVEFHTALVAARILMIALGIGQLRVRGHLQGHHRISRALERDALAPTPPSILCAPKASHPNECEHRASRRWFERGAYPWNSIGPKVTLTRRQAHKRARPRVVLAVRADEAQRIICAALGQELLVLGRLHIFTKVD